MTNMEILFRGTPPEERKWKGTCGYCNSEIQANENEVEVSYLESKDLWRDVKKTGKADCPVCEHQMTFYPEYE